MIITITRIEVPNVIKPESVDLTGDKAAAFLAATGFNVAFNVRFVMIKRWNKTVHFIGDGCTASVEAGEGIESLLEIGHKIATGK